MKIVSVKFGVVIVALVALQGCMWGRMQINDPTIADRVKLIRPGVTRAENLASILGAQPTMRMPGKDRLLLGYTYGDTKANGLVLILFNFSRSTTVTDTLYIEADAKTGVVTAVYPPKKHDVEWRFWPFGDE